MLKIYNSLTNKIEVFEPKTKNHVNMYVCGPTVYDNIHIGNGRPVVFFDVVKRYLEFRNYSVTYASNITDIDDKIINKAKDLKVSEKEIAQKYADQFFEVIKRVGAKPFDETPYATDYIPEMIEFISDLIENGFAYQVPSGVYFDVSKLKDYGVLSNRKIEDLISNVRIENESDKHDSVDFTLWKITDEGIKYDSPWGMGRPGWHTECVVMNNKLFGDNLDIHGGGFDLKFPHHENEIAQSMAHDHHHLATYWMHVGRLDFGKEKMSKSLGNDIKLKDLLENYDGGAYRLMLLAHHYRAPIAFTTELMEQYQKTYDKISNTLNKWNFKFRSMGMNTKFNIEDYQKRLNDLITLMDNDFDTPNVISLIDATVKDLNKEEDIELFIKLKGILNVLGVEPKINEPEQKDLKTYEDWLNARNNKDFAKADELRNILSQKGWI
ncbi:cysteine--tRNA ligase [Acholeplasma equirhinis]|uniref:cysteine--tRNA ligase n=1 Tax=Acholeplasma equirhinis TaxID=555393 RepID=UPI00197AC85C|nr:cysteine--tRNA ligase [Acholeplasma equirhinis]MBN3490901.1 cysteine--tRNA ligase [Acholeplasma equirhinis]